MPGNAYLHNSVCISISAGPEIIAVTNLTTGLNSQMAHRNKYLIQPGWTFQVDWTLALRRSIHEVKKDFIADLNNLLMLFAMGSLFLTREVKQ